MNKQELTKLLPIIQIEFELKSKQKVAAIKAANDKEIEFIISVEGSIFTPPSNEYSISLIDINNRQLTLRANFKVFKESLKFYNGIMGIKKKEKTVKIS